MWDSILADPRRQRGFFCLQVCVAMLLLQKETILENEFGDNVKLLQAYPETDLAVLLDRSYLLCFEECQMAGGACVLLLLASVECQLWVLCFWYLRLWYLCRSSCLPAI
jgi:hypothetical protein